MGYYTKEEEKEYNKNYYIKNKEKIKIKCRMRYDREHNTWFSMKARCLNKNNPDYKYYGGRGIIVCKEWLKFENFFADMGKRPIGRCLDRIDNSKGYSKENCRWITQKEQMRNRRNNKMITFQEKTLCMVEWAEKLNINYDTLRARLEMNWSIEKAFTK